jgi:hypothetical protein
MLLYLRSDGFVVVYIRDFVVEFCWWAVRSVVLVIVPLVERVGELCTWLHRVFFGILQRSFLLFLLLVSVTLVGMLPRLFRVTFVSSWWIH